jgi:hypothetical protein
MARALGGEVSGQQVSAPGPGHSPKDRSLSIKIDPTAPDGFITHSFANDDLAVCRDHVRSMLGLPAFQAKKSSGNGGGAEPWKFVAEYVYLLSLMSFLSYLPSIMSRYLPMVSPLALRRCDQSD